MVYDGSTRSPGNSLSLNDCLQKRPNLVPKLLNVLIRFHTYPVALIADIKKAFLMIEIQEKDRDILRFLWYRDLFKRNSEVVHLRFTRLVFGLRPSPAILGAVIAQH